MTSANRTTKALLWSASGQAISQLVTISTNILLARLLLPQDFGIFGAAIIFTRVLTVLAGLGIQDLVLRRTELDTPFLSTILALSLSVGAIIMVTTIAAASFLADLVNSPDTMIVLRILPVGIFITTTAGLPRSLLIRRMAQRKIAQLEVAAMVGFTIVTITLALLGAGFWTLVAGSLVTAIISSGLAWRYAGAWVKPWFYREELWPLLSSGLKIATGNMLVWVGGVTDNFMVSRFMGVISLGFYTFAFNLAFLPVQKLTSVVNAVFQARLADAYRAGESVWREYLFVTTYKSVLLWLPLTIMIITAPELVMVIYGDKWEPAIRLVQVLTMGMIVGSIVNPSYTIYPLYNRSIWITYVTIIHIIVTATVIGLLLDFGTLSAALGFTVANTSNTLINVWATMRLTEGNIPEFLRAILPASTMALGSGVVGGIARMFFINTIPAFVVLILVAVIICLAYGTILFIGFPKIRHLLLSSLLRSLSTAQNGRFAWLEKRLLGWV